MNTASLMLRVGALAALLVAAHFWADRHLGIGFGSPGPFSALVVAVSGVLGIIDKLLEKSEKESIGDRVRGMSRFALATPALIVAFLVAGVVFGSYSSILIVPGSASVKLETVSVPEPDSDKPDPRCWEPAGNPRRFLCAVGLFGSVFQVAVPGYLRETVFVYPLTGANVRIDRDLREAPSVLLRPPPRALFALANGRLVVRRKNSDDLEAERKGKQASFLLGRRRPLPTTHLSLWRLDLEAENLAPETREQITARVLRMWRRPEFIPLDETLGPGTEMEAEVRNANDGIVACADFVLGEEELQDVLMWEGQECKE